MKITLAKHQDGTALISALFLVTLVVIIATTLAVRLEVDIARTSLLLNHDRLFLLAEEVEYWSVIMLDQDIHQTHPQKMPYTLGPIKQGDIIITGSLDKFQHTQNFLVTADVQLGKQHFILYSLFQRSVNNDDTVITRLWQRESWV